MKTRPEKRDRGSVMPMTAVLITFLMIGAWALVSASQQWSVRRDAQGVAAAVARAGAQGDPAALRRGGVIDTTAATVRAEAILDTAGYSGVVTIDGDTVSVTVHAAIDYAFPSPGFPSSVSATASAAAVRGVTGEAGG